MKEIVIIVFKGRTYRGPVTSKDNMAMPGEPDNWYVEFIHDQKSEGRTGDPGYVKQVYDQVSSLKFVQE